MELRKLVSVIAGLAMRIGVVRAPLPLGQQTPLSDALRFASNGETSKFRLISAVTLAY